MGIKRATAAFGYMVGDPPTPRVVNPGMLFDESDPVVTRYANMFEDVETHVSDRKERTREAVEAATAAPGERRSVETIPKRSKRRRSADEAPVQPTEEEQQAADLGLVDPDADH
jgi:hypothetical protein